MTTITFGGGPTIDARRSFSNLKPGAEVPGFLNFPYITTYFKSIISIKIKSFKAMVDTSTNINITVDILMVIKLTC